MNLGLSTSLLYFLITFLVIKSHVPHCSFRRAVLLWKAESQLCLEVLWLRKVCRAAFSGCSPGDLQQRVWVLRHVGSVVSVPAQDLALSPRRLLPHSSNTKYFFSRSEPPSCCAWWHRGVWEAGVQEGFGKELKLKVRTLRWRRAEGLKAGWDGLGLSAGGEREGGREGRMSSFCSAPSKPDLQMPLRFCTQWHCTLELLEMLNMKWCVVPGLYSA